MVEENLTAEKVKVHRIQDMGHRIQDSNPYSHPQKIIFFNLGNAVDADCAGDGNGVWSCKACHDCCCNCFHPGDIFVFCANCGLAPMWEILVSFIVLLVPDLPMKALLQITKYAISNTQYTLPSIPSRILITPSQTSQIKDSPACQKTFVADGSSLADHLPQLHLLPQL